ncbi:hypothetical protein AWU67_06760 [Microterricola viridarii]|uniref:Uncharacterized protein n=1 Tax=Microterricola viridarii TaxID=412690 RepID=A0A120I0Z9_9MICO|nr:hypothetical protein AWU67_06760 [Microterricola viridarii]
MDGLDALEDGGSLLNGVYVIEFWHGERGGDRERHPSPRFRHFYREVTTLHPEGVRRRFLGDSHEDAFSDDGAAGVRRRRIGDPVGSAAGSARLCGVH